MLVYFDSQNTSNAVSQVHFKISQTTVEIGAAEMSKNQLEKRRFLYHPHILTTLGDNILVS